MGDDKTNSRRIDRRAIARQITQEPLPGCIRLSHRLISPGNMCFLAGPTAANADKVMAFLGLDHYMATFFTIGHSTRSAAELIYILQSSGIKVLVDVRAIPRSRTNPQFNRDVLPQTLSKDAIDYVHMAELGGRRGRSLAHSPNTFWQNQSFRNFADYAMTDAFRQGFLRLQQLGAAKPSAIMCSELLWWRCHRRIFADYLMLAGHTVIHILDRDKREEARPTPAARRLDNDQIVYGGPVTGDLFSSDPAPD
jgi:uncharacterized protein (DUF488 family)